MNTTYTAVVIALTLLASGALFILSAEVGSLTKQAKQPLDWSMDPIKLVAFAMVMSALSGWFLAKMLT